MVFALPADSGEKIGLAITALLALTVAIEVVSQNTPPTPDSMPQPLVTSFFVMVIFMMVMTCIISTLVLVFNHHNADLQPEMGFILRYIFLVFLPFFMRMTPPGETSPPPWRALTCKCTWKDRCRRFQVSDEPVKPMDSKPEKERSKELVGSDMDCIKASIEALKSSLKELDLFWRNEMSEKSDGGRRVVRGSEEEME